MTTWELRLKLCESAAQRLSILEEIADEASVDPKVRVTAIAVMMMYGLGVPQVVEQAGSLFGTPSKQ